MNCFPPELSFLSVRTSEMTAKSSLYNGFSEALDSKVERFNEIDRISGATAGELDTVAQHVFGQKEAV